MTVQKISTILNEYYGISNSQNKWIRLPQISTIFLDQEANIFLDKNQIFYFDSKTESLFISDHHNLNENIDTLKLTDIKYKTQVSMDKICGFISTTMLGPCGVYINKPFL